MYSLCYVLFVKDLCAKINSDFWTYYIYVVRQIICKSLVWNGNLDKDKSVDTKWCLFVKEG
jgi:hypothetical protein